MNTTIDYQDFLQRATLRYLMRHQLEHLGDDTQLFQRTAHHMAKVYEMRLSEAETLVNKSMTELAVARGRERLDMATGSNHTIVTDPSTGQSWAIPVSLIIERIIDTPDHGCYRIAVL
jgi:hypothetical protein